jgi:hypothetical protein
MKLDYPKYEMIFALQDEGDEALPVVRMIMDKYKEVDARVIIGKSGFSGHASRFTSDMAIMSDRDLVCWMILTPCR